MDEAAIQALIGEEVPVSEDEDEDDENEVSRTIWPHPP